MAADRVIYQLFYFAKMPKGRNGEDIDLEKGTVIRPDRNTRFRVSCGREHGTIILRVKGSLDLQ